MVGSRPLLPEVGLGFSVEYDIRDDEMLCNFPQELIHLSHISTAVALTEHQGSSQK